ncbi:CBS domain-containing protein [Nitrospina watsonii]|uniref:CBS domain-containing protein n=1 Tax=Nitrospina watsonii TaxID=1323948 RepID=A0ABN8W015_9BACT|nr:CBS domain-containing protein [Nitrospina watsonii]CAI2719374.1 conserved protein of unknown function [Nitrospina watsonii]
MTTGNTVGDQMSKTLFFTGPETTAFDAVDKMYQNKVSALLIQIDGEFKGIFTKTDWRNLILQGQADPHKAKVGDLMTSPIITIDKNETVGRATMLMEEKVFRHLAVTDNGKIVGMLSVKDLEKFYYKMHQKTNF